MQALKVQISQRTQALWSVLLLFVIGVTPIMQVTHVRNKNSNVQGRSLTVIKVIFHTKEMLINERIRYLWKQILSFKRTAVLKRDAIEENHCLIQ